MVREQGTENPETNLRGLLNRIDAVTTGWKQRGDKVEGAPSKPELVRAEAKTMVELKKLVAAGGITAEQKPGVLEALRRIKGWDDQDAEDIARKLEKQLSGE